MATRYGTNATKAYAQGVSPNAGISQLAEQGEQTGRVHTLYDEFTQGANTLTLGDKIRMGGLIPAGARIVNAFIDSDDFGVAADCTVGWEASDPLFNGTAEAANTKGFFDTYDLTTAAKAQMLNTAVKGAAAAASEGKFKKFTAPVQPYIAVTTTCTTPITTATVRLCIQYTFD